jgi:hypothetical protein
MPKAFESYTAYAFSAEEVERLLKACTDPEDFLLVLLAVQRIVGESRLGRRAAAELPTGL